VIKGVLGDAAKRAGFSADQVIGIGIDTTGSTPIPVDAKGEPLAFAPEFKDNPAAMAYLWKDHTGHVEAHQITELAHKKYPPYVAKSGGTYSAEWFWAKVLHCRRATPEVFDAAYTWVELADWVPAVLCGTTSPDTLKRGICAAGHKAIFHKDWGGYPSEDFLSELDPALVLVRRSLPDAAYTVGEKAGTLSAEWAGKTGLKQGIPVSVGAFDCHLGAVGAGIEPGILAKIIGTSTCDIMVAPDDGTVGDIPGLCGIVPGSVLPGYLGLEAGQSAVGDIFNWFVNVVQPSNQGHGELTAAAAALRPGESGLLALDWHNGNRTVLVDQRLTGGVIGLTLHTTPAELYRAWIEATAFGARVIAERFGEYGQTVKGIIACGGISAKNPLVMQIYADVLNAPVRISSSAQTCALGSAIAGAVAAGAYSTFAEAMSKMAAPADEVYNPDPVNAATYEKLYRLYRRLHDSYGIQGSNDLYDVMKVAMDIRDEVRRVANNH
jgi:L-ribulokinase